MRAPHSLPRLVGRFGTTSRTAVRMSTVHENLGRPG
jgi:hypothetical protein